MPSHFCGREIDIEEMAEKDWVAKLFIDIASQKTFSFKKRYSSGDCLFGFVLSIQEYISSKVANHVAAFATYQSISSSIVLNKTVLKFIILTLIVNLLFCKVMCSSTA